MIIVSGCPRSGTSLTMDIMRVALGDDAIVGHKFPQERRITRVRTKQPRENANEYEARMYLWDKRNPKWQEELAHAKNMNPNGFWECEYTVQGIKDTGRGGEHDAAELLATCKYKVCKIVSQGIPSSDTKYIDKIVMLLRHPREVAKSQEALRRTMPADMLPSDTPLKVHSPAMFNRVTYAFAKWRINHPDVPLLAVQHSALLANPVDQVERIRQFVQREGDWDAAAQVVTPKLKRSVPENRDGGLWDDAEKIWEMSEQQDWSGIVQYFEDSKEERATQRDGKSWLCTRWGGRVTDQMCVQCRNNATVRANFRKTATQRGIDWNDEPCMYEVAYGPQDVVKISIDESIRNNFWRDDAAELEARLDAEGYDPSTQKHGCCDPPLE